MAFQRVTLTSMSMIYWSMAQIMTRPVHHWILDCTFRVGFICQQVKTKPPSQNHKCCGFIYDYTGLPTISIPKDKFMRAKAHIQLVRSYQQSDPSRLALSVLLGTLQPFGPAPPDPLAPPSCGIYTLTFISLQRSTSVSLIFTGQLDLG
jgi:hypothetical protein